ncbi:Vacuolar import and degradation protein 27, partial [Dispira simplex]
MFALKTLSQVLWGGNEPEEVAIIPAGELYLVRPTSVKGPRECVFKDAQLALVRSTLPHQYLLVVSRVYEEGEEALDSDVGTARDEHASATDADLRFYVSESEGRPALVWSTATGDPEERFEFVVDTSQLGLDKAQAQTAQFEQAVQNCIYEGIYKQDAKTADPQLLRSLTNPPVSTPTLSSPTITHVIHAPESPSLRTTTDDFPTSLPSDNETDYEYLEEEEEEQEEFGEVNDDYSDDEPNEHALPNILPDSSIPAQPSDHLPGAFPSSDDVPRGAMNDYTSEEYESETDSDDLESLLSSEDDTA